LTEGLRKLLARLVAFPSVSGRPNGEIAGFIAGWLEERGATVRRIADPTGLHENLFASCGRADDPAPMLSAHMDVVDVAGQDWSGDPFVLREHVGRFVGRGTADMKGFLTCALLAAERALAAGRPLHLAITTDEEIGCLGARTLAPAVAAMGVRSTIVVVGEPTGMARATAHKGKLALRVHVRGRAAHSALAPRGENAVVTAAHLVVGLDEMAARLAREEGRDPRFSLPHSTVSVGPIHGGVALNIVPDTCAFEVEMRNVPGDDAEQLVRWLSESADGRVEIEEIARYPALDGVGDQALDFGTEGGIWREVLGVPVEVRGPGNIADAHRADEAVSADQLELCCAYLDSLLLR
jgi:acetylornithine deacetylase